MLLGTTSSDPLKLLRMVVAVVARIMRVAVVVVVAVSTRFLYHIIQIRLHST